MNKSKTMDYGKGLKIGTVGLLIMFFGLSLKFFDIPKVAWLIMLVGILVCMIGAAIHAVLLFKKLKKDLGY